MGSALSNRILKDIVNNNHASQTTKMPKKIIVDADCLSSQENSNNINYSNAQDHQMTKKCDVTSTRNMNILNDANITKNLLK